MWIGHRLPLKALLTSTWHQVLLVLVTASAVTLVYLEYLSPWPKTPAVGVSVLGISLAFFIGFLSVHAYKRWWQGRRVPSPATYRGFPVTLLGWY